jgi:hypothetical protein
MVSPFQELPAKILHAFFTSLIPAAFFSLLIFLEQQKFYTLVCTSTHLLSIVALTPIFIHFVQVEFTRICYWMELLYLCFVCYQS